jgi:hypothetical protein
VIVLAFDDAAMARLLIAATGVAPPEFPSWIADICRRLDAPPHPSQADYQRTYRARQRNCCRVVPVELTVEREETLVATGLLHPQATDDRRAASVRQQGCPPINPDLAHFFFDIRFAPMRLPMLCRSMVAPTLPLSIRRGRRAARPRS